MEETVGQRLKRLRKSAHLTQTALANQAGLVQGAVGNIESGNRGYGSSVVAIASALNTSPEYLMLESDDPKPLGETTREIIVEPVKAAPIQARQDIQLTQEAAMLGRSLDKLPYDSLLKLQANQACLQIIIDALLQLENEQNRKQVKLENLKKPTA